LLLVAAAQPVEAQLAPPNQAGVTFGHVHLSVKNAEIQVLRVGKARGLSEEKVRDLVKQNTEGPQFGILGDSGVNVLKLNLALDEQR
jgi:K+-transporting ATPase ATPase C chain